MITTKGTLTLSLKQNSATKYNYFDVDLIILGFSMKEYLVWPISSIGMNIISS